MSASIHGAARIVLRPIGNPLPLGFLGLAAATLLVSGLQLEWLAPTDGKAVAYCLIGFVFPTQLVSSIFGYLARDVVAGTSMGILAGTWLSMGLITLNAPRPGATSDALGLFLLIAAVAMLVPAAAATTGKLVPALVLATTALRFFVTGIFQITASDTWMAIAGVVGLVLCAFAVYAALAMGLEDAKRETVLPLGRRGYGRSAIGGGLDGQLELVDREAGVREQL
jgi:succinate-acetate transporter protein